MDALEKKLFAPDYFHMIDLLSENIYVGSHSYHQCTEVSFLWLFISSKYFYFFNLCHVNKRKCLFLFGISSNICDN